MSGSLDQQLNKFEFLTKKVASLEAQQAAQNPSANQSAPTTAPSPMETAAKQCGFNTPQEIDRFKNGMWPNYKKRNRL